MARPAFALSYLNKLKKDSLTLTEKYTFRFAWEIFGNDYRVSIRIHMKLSDL